MCVCVFVCACVCVCLSVCACACVRVCVCERERVSETMKISSDYILDILGTRCRSWLRHCATSRKVAGFISDGVIGIFHSHNPSGRTVAPGVDSACNRNEYQGYFLGGKGGRCIGLPTLPP